MGSNPNFEQAAYFNNLGVSQSKDGNLAAAISFLQKSLKLYPDYEKPLYNIGSLEISRGKYKVAIRYLRRFIRLNDQHLASYYKLAHALFMEGNTREAEINYQKALKMDPNYFEAQMGLGYLYIITGNYPQASKQLEKASRTNPNDAYLIGLLLGTYKAIADFEGIDKWTPVLNRLTSRILKTGDGRVESPFDNVTRKDDSIENFRVAKSWSKVVQGSVAEFKTNFPFNDRKKAKPKINVGYLSDDFRDHPVSHLMSGLFRRHDRGRFRIFTYSSGPDEKSFWRNEIKENSDFFRDIRQKSNLEAAELIYEDGVDILVDLMGYTRNSRLEIMALRPSPIQVTWLGFPGTIGADFIDYIIADKIVLPEKDLPFYTEKPLYLPCYQMNSTLPETTKKRELKRSDFGLPEKSFVFSSFNQTYKIEPEAFSIWMEILKAVSGSVLWQLRTNNYVEKNLKKEAKKRGIDPERIIFAPKIPRSQHLERLVLADLGLDTFTYNGHTTTSDALWAGVPVVTLKGNHFASRVSASLLSTIGLPELITYSKENYKNLAIRLATYPEEFKKIKEKIAQNKLSSSLFDARKFVKDLEKIYGKIWNELLTKNAKMKS